MKNLAPIVLFVYNRPWHTEQTIEALKQNELAEESELFIYSDGAKNEETIQKVQEVRDYIKTINGFKKVTIIERDRNWGLADSIIDGVTDIVNKFGKIIVLEDDIVTSPYFLRFMNDALNFYENQEKVWHISSWNYPIESENTSTTFLWRVMNCWGWATWKNRWKNFEKNTDKVIDTFSQEEIKRFNLDGFYDFWSQVLANRDNKINTWAIYWYATIFQNDGLCLNPVRPLIKNIGFDENGTHTKQFHTLVEHSINFMAKYIFTTEISENRKYVSTIKNYLNDLNNNSIKKRFSDDDYQLLRKTQRFEEITINFLDKKIKAPDAASLLFLNHELFGLEIYKFICEKENPTIIDCGANIGLSVIYFKKLFPDAQIVAFEPDKTIFDYLKFNIKSFGFNDIHLINKGLWKEETTLNFFSEGADGGRVADPHMTQKVIKIETVRLSDYLKNGKVDFLKIDIEGAETSVLIECQEYLMNVDKIFIEYHSFTNQPQTLSTILSILEKSGFRYYIEHIGVKSKHPFLNITDCVGFDNQLNIFGYKK